MGLQNELPLGDTSAMRDWGHAAEYVRGMWLSLQHPTASDYVFATGQAHSVQQIVEIAFETVGLNWKQYVRQDTRLIRPAEPAKLLGNPAKAEQVLGWKRSISFQQLIQSMVRAELDLLQRPASG